MLKGEKGNPIGTRRFGWSEPLSRREFVLRSAAGAAAVALGCSDPPAPKREPAVLGWRPHPPTSELPPGLRRLNIGSGRDGFIYVPPTYEHGTPAPLLVLLHGAGQDSTEWSDGPLAELVDDLGIIVLGPDSRLQTWDVAMTGQLGIDTPFIDRALEWTFDQCNIDPARIGLGGFSDGASCALSLGITNGNLFSAVIGFSPGFVHADAQVGSPRVFISHGNADNVLPVQNPLTIVSTLRSEDVVVTYEEFVGGHTVTREIARQAFEWFVS